MIERRYLGGDNIQQEKKFFKVKSSVTRYNNLKLDH